MSADILRRAASLMRERAEAVSYPTPWVVSGGTCSIRSDEARNYVASTYGGVGTEEAAAQHIASWHPAVALAVADMLDEAALTVEVMGPWDWDYPEGPMDATGSLRPEVRRALAVARAYLGEAA